MIPYTPPAYDMGAFNCPFCHAFADQVWSDAYGETDRGGFRQIVGTRFSVCMHCKKIAIWFAKKMIHPESTIVEPPSYDLSEEIRKDYEEASTVLQKSPRSAAALLRLAVQKLCVQLGKPGKNVNLDIASLVKDGLPEKIQKALDTVRVTGNESVHPGTLDLRDSPEIAAKLFKLVNFIAEKMLTEPKEIDELYKKLPRSKLDEIEKRDNLI